MNDIHVEKFKCLRLIFISTRSLAAISIVCFFIIRLSSTHALNLWFCLTCLVMLHNLKMGIKCVNIKRAAVDGYLRSIVSTFLLPFSVSFLPVFIDLVTSQDRSILR